MINPLKQLTIILRCQPNVEFGFFSKPLFKHQLEKSFLTFIKMKFLIRPMNEMKTSFYEKAKI